MKELPTACNGFLHTCEEEQAALMAEWIASRGGVAVWTSADLSNPCASWSTPANEKDGTPKRRPTWQAEAEPVIITDPTKIGVTQSKEVKRFHVGTRMGSQGFKIKVTDGGSRRIRKEVAKAGDGAFHAFDYGDYENAVIYKPCGWKSLAEWTKERED